VPLMCWVFNCASAGATLQTQATTAIISILEKTRFVRNCSPFWLSNGHRPWAECVGRSVPARHPVDGCRRLASCGGGAQILRSSECRAGADPVPAQCALAGRGKVQSAHKLSTATALTCREPAPKTPVCRSISRNRITCAVAKLVIPDTTPRSSRVRRNRTCLGQPLEDGGGCLAARLGFNLTIVRCDARRRTT